MDREPFFRATDDPTRFEPTDVARGPWGHDSLHGHVLGGLMAHVVEVRHGDPAFQPARLTVDMFRPPTFGSATVTTEVVRDGNRVRAVDTALAVDGVRIARASLVMLRRAEQAPEQPAGQPPGHVWSPPSWDAPPPTALEGFDRESDRDPAWETRTVSGGPDAPAARHAAWMRELRHLVAGVDHSPLVRAAMAADFTNPLANSGDRGLEFVNADYTLYLHRLPVGEWIGVEASSHHSAQGIAVATCALYDLDGPIGRTAVAAVANRHP